MGCLAVDVIDGEFIISGPGSLHKGEFEDAYA